MILVWGLREDPPTAAVLDALARRGASCAFLDQRAGPPERWSVRFGSRVSGWVDLPQGGRVDLAEVRSAFVRAYDDADLPELQDLLATPAGQDRVLRFSAALSAWCEVAPGLVVTRAAAQQSNTSKPYQQVLLRRAGWETPASLVTTDPAAARAFVRRHGAVIYKSVSSVRSIVSRLDPAQLDRLDDVRGCPTLLQAHVPGVDHRVHVVGQRLFACEIRSASDDYRYDAAVRQRPVVLPDDVAQRCRTTARLLDLPLAGLDLRRTPDGRWVCFEANPSPGFTCFEQDGRADIADAVAELLDLGDRAAGAPAGTAGTTPTRGFYDHAGVVCSCCTAASAVVNASAATTVQQSGAAGHGRAREPGEQR